MVNQAYHCAINKVVWSFEILSYRLQQQHISIKMTRNGVNSAASYIRDEHCPLRTDFSIIGLIRLVCLTWHCHSFSFSSDEDVNVHLVQGVIGRIDFHPPPGSVGVLALGLDQVEELARREHARAQQQRNFEENRLKSADA